MVRHYFSLNVKGTNGADLLLTHKVAVPLDICIEDGSELAFGKSLLILNGDFNRNNRLPLKRLYGRGKEAMGFGIGISGLCFSPKNI